MKTLCTYCSKFGKKKTGLWLALLLAFTAVNAHAIKANAARTPAPASTNAIAPAPATPAASPTIQSAEAQDIHEIRPPYPLPSPWTWVAYGTGGLALAALFFGVRQWRRGKRVEHLKLPYEIALEKLEATRRLLHPEQARAFSLAVSEVTREYVEQHFGVRARHHTTWEFLQDLATRADSPLASYRPLLGEFLYHCDLAKFARWILAAPEMEAMLASACRFVRETGQPPPHSAPDGSEASGPGLEGNMAPSSAHGPVPQTGHTARWHLTGVGVASSANKLPEIRAPRIS